MKYFFVFIIIAVISCTAVQKPTTPIVFQPQKPSENINDYVPFTRELYNEIKGKVDINKVRFFISNSVVLNRGTVKNEISVGNNGELQSSSQTNEKIIELVSKKISQSCSIEANLYNAYYSLLEGKIVCDNEIRTLEAWLKDISNLKKAY